MILTTGFSKAGNHALVKAVQLLGHPCVVEHLPFTGPTGQHVFIKRDPRNIICSWLRFQGNPVTPGMFITYFRNFDGVLSLADALAQYEGWLTDAATLVVSYEALIASDVEMKRIAAHLNTPYLAGAFDELPGLTVTWCDVHSDYHTIWTPEVEAVWSAEGGPALLARWGY